MEVDSSNELVETVGPDEIKIFMIVATINYTSLHEFFRAACYIIKLISSRLQHSLTNSI